jgi:hypothetical protein
VKPALVQKIAKGHLSPLTKLSDPKWWWLRDSASRAEASVCYLPTKWAMNARLSVRLYHKQMKSPGCVSKKKPVIWHLQDVRTWVENKMLKEINAIPKQKPSLWGTIFWVDLV